MADKNASSKYIPSKGDVVLIDFNPQIGKEITKRRPALILSPQEYNKYGLAIAVPITSKVKGYPFEVVIKNKQIEGVVLADAVKSLDWKERNAKFITSVSSKDLLEVLKLLSLLLRP